MFSHLSEKGLSVLPALASGHGEFRTFYVASSVSIIFRSIAIGSPIVISPMAIYTVLYIPSLCIVHLMRASLNYVSWKQRKQVAADLKPVYQASTPEEAQLRLVEFTSKWDQAYPTIAQMWRRNWDHVTPFFAYPAEIRKVVYTTNAIESLNMSLRKVIKTRGSFPTEEAAMKMLYLALEHIAKKWTMPVQDWKGALQRFAILFGDRVPAEALA